MAVIYLTTPGTSLHRQGDRLQLKAERTELAEYRLFEIERVVVVGNVQLTSQAIAILLERGIDVSFLSSRGRPRGALVSNQSRNVFLRLAQFERWHDDSFRVTMARSIVPAKIAAQIRLVERHLKNHPDSRDGAALDVMRQQHAAAAAAESVAQAMGFEGAASASYFQCFAAMSRRLPFPGRKRRPPTDPVNALLSLGYVLLSNEMAGMIEARGFDPYIGFVHGIRYGRQSLPLDLVEPFRQPVIDRLTLRLVNLGQFGLNDFEGGDDGVRLLADSFKQYIRYYEDWLRAPHAAPGTPTWREVIRSQVEQLRASVMTGAPMSCYTWVA